MTEVKPTLTAHLGRTLCKTCGNVTHIPGFDWCEKCTIDQSISQVTISDVADVIMQMDHIGMLEEDRRMYMRRYAIHPIMIACAQEEVELRYIAMGKPRHRYRGWNG